MSSSAVTLCDPTQTAALLPYPALMEHIARAARQTDAGEICAPERQALPFPDGSMMLSMPATAADIGVHKLVNVFAGNSAYELPTIHGIVAAYDGKTGRPRLLLDGPTVTERRTVAVSMLGLSRLLPLGPKRALIIGSGTQAYGHARALLELYPEVQITVMGRSAAKSSAFAASLAQPRVTAWRHDAHAAQLLLDSPRAGALPSDFDLVITATTSSTPVYDLPAQAGRHIIAVGAYRADLAEIGAATIATSSLFVDDLAGARQEAGDYLQAKADWQHIRRLTELLELAAAPAAAIFKTVGCAAWDLAAARCALEHATP